MKLRRFLQQTLIDEMKNRRIEWSQQFEVGVDQLDDDHGNIVELINEFGMNCCTDRAKPILDNLFEVTREHFDSEEKFLIRNGLSNKNHQDEHGKILRELRKHIDDPNNYSNTAYCDDSFDKLAGWFINHSIGLDSDIKAYFDSGTMRFS